mmetsp:Transcript_15001/g.62461  ORF Transcript_15001/g.62461 Transcript_15001/m.62461 type:complete len:251 (+) Transcript_15001:222-974(+)
MTTSRARAFAAAASCSPSVCCVRGRRGRRRPSSPSRATASMRSPSCLMRRLRRTGARAPVARARAVSRCAAATRPPPLCQSLAARRSSTPLCASTLAVARSLSRAARAWRAQTHRLLRRCLSSAPRRSCTRCAMWRRVQVARTTRRSTRSPGPSTRRSFRAAAAVPKARPMRRSLTPMWACPRPRPGLSQPCRAGWSHGCSCPGLHPRRNRNRLRRTSRGGGRPAQRPPSDFVTWRARGERRRQRTRRPP